MISGKDRGKSGRVLRTEPAQGARVRRGPEHDQAPHPPAGIAGGASGQDTAAQLGGVIEREGPIHISNVMLLDPKASRRACGSIAASGKRSRVAVRSGATID